MNPTPEQTEKMRERMRQIIARELSIQILDKNRNNYLESCIKHGGLIAEVAQEFKTN